MRHRASASRAAKLAALTAPLLLTALPGASASAASCHREDGPRCAAAVHAERAAARAAHWAQLRAAPALKLEGDTLSWSAVPGVQRYVVVRVIAGRPRVRHVIEGTSWEPRAVPGETVEYIVRTHFARSRWSAAVTISFPAAAAKHDRTERASRSSDRSASGSLSGASGSGASPASPASPTSPIAPISPTSPTSPTSPSSPASPTAPTSPASPSPTETPAA